MTMRGRHETEPAAAVAASDADDERLAGVLVAAGAGGALPARRGPRPRQTAGTLAEQLIAAGVVTGRGARAHASPTTTACPVLDFRDVEPGPGRAGPAHPGRRRARFARCRIARRRRRGRRSPSLDPSPPRIDAVTAVVGRRVVPAVATHRDLDRALDIGYRATARRRQPGPGLRGPRPAAAGGRPARTRRRQRGRPGRPGRPDGHHPGPAGPRLRHPHRAVRRPDPGALPHRRRAARRARPARAPSARRS